MLIHMTERRIDPKGETAISARAAVRSAVMETARGWRGTVFASAALALGLLAGTVGWWRTNTVSAIAAAAADGVQLPKTVAALGRIEPQSEIINIGSGITDRLEVLLVHRGELVKKGQVLGYLQSYTEQVAQREQLAAQLSEARLKLKTEMELDRIKIESADIKLKTINQVSPLKIEAQVATIKGMEAMLKNNRAVLETQTDLLAKNATTRRIYNDQQALVLQGEGNLASAKAHLAELEHQFEADVADAEAQLRLAKASLERAKADFAIESLAKQVALADVRANRATVYAPIDGRILNIMAHAGELVGPSPILTMGNTEKMRAVAEVYETDTGRIEIGQTAQVTSRTLTTPVTGHVVEIGQMIFKNDVLNVDPAAKSDARVVEVRIELDDAERTQYLTNHTVDVIIHVDEAVGAKVSRVSTMR